MDYEEFRTKITALLPDASYTAMNHWLRYVGEMEEHIPRDEMLDDLYLSFSMVANNQDKATATALFNHGTTICLNPFDLMEAGRLVHGGAPLQEITDLSIAGRLDPTEQDVNEITALRDVLRAERESAAGPLTMKLYSPVNFYLRDDENLESYDETHYWRDEMTHEEAFEYLGEIDMRLDKEFDDDPGGLAQYLDSIILKMKVQSVVPSFEPHGDKLWTVADIKLNEPLTATETEWLKEWWTGQLSDGWGESFEQREIPVGGGELYVEPWTPGLAFFIDTQEEFDVRMGFARRETAAPQQERQANQPAHRIAGDSPIPPPPDPDRDDVLEWIARQHCGVETLDIRGNDRQDFHEISVWALKNALAAAFDEGQARQAPGRDTPALSPEREPARGSTTGPGLEEKRAALLARIDQCLGFYQIALKHMDKQRVVDMAEEIATRHAVRDYLHNYHQFNEHEVSFLLQYIDPLEVLAEHCPPAAMQIDMSGALYDITALDGALKRSYDLMPEPRDTGRLQELRDRLEQNKADLLYGMLQDLAEPGLSQQDKVELAQSITEVVSAHDCLDNYDFPADEVDYLLQFENPLALFSERWPAVTDAMLNMDYQIEDILANRAAHSEFARVQDSPAETRATGKDGDRPSLLASLHRERERPSPPRDKPAADKPGPEL